MKNLTLDKTDRYTYVIGEDGFEGLKVFKDQEDGSYYVLQWDDETETEIRTEIDAPPGIYTFLKSNSVRKISSFPQLSNEGISFTEVDGEYSHQMTGYTFTLDEPGLASSGYCDYDGRRNIYGLYTGTTSAAYYYGTVLESQIIRDSQELIPVQTNFYEYTEDGKNYFYIEQFYDTNEENATSYARVGQFFDAMTPGVDYNKKDGIVSYNPLFPKLLNDVKIGEADKTVTWEEAGMTDKIFKSYFTRLRYGTISQYGLNSWCGQNWLLATYGPPPNSIYGRYCKDDGTGYLRFNFRDRGGEEEYTTISATQRTVKYSNPGSDIK